MTWALPAESSSVTGTPPVAALSVKFCWASEAGRIGSEKTTRTESASATFAPPATGETEATRGGSTFMKRSTEVKAPAVPLPAALPRSCCTGSRAVSTNGAPATGTTYLPASPESAARGSVSELTSAPVNGAESMPVTLPPAYPAAILVSTKR